MTTSSSKRHAAMGATLAGGLLLAGSAFAMTDLAGGYMQAAGAVAGAQDTPEQPATPKHREGACGVASMDTDQDGKVSRSEFAAAHEGSDERFADHDLDGDGFMTQAEMDTHHAAMKDRSGDDAASEAADSKTETEGKCGEGKCGGEGACGGSL